MRLQNHQKNHLLWPVTSEMAIKYSCAARRSWRSHGFPSLCRIWSNLTTSELFLNDLWCGLDDLKFDRYARFKSHGSAEKFLDGKKMCKNSKSNPIYSESSMNYSRINTIQNRIKLNDNSQKLEKTAQAIYMGVLWSWISWWKRPQALKSNEGKCLVRIAKRIPRGGEWETWRINTLNFVVRFCRSVFERLLWEGTRVTNGLRTLNLTGNGLSFDDFEICVKKVSSEDKKSQLNMVILLVATAWFKNGMPVIFEKLWS